MKHTSSESLRIGLFLALTGGFLESHTFICRGQVFANCQTGNMVLLAMHLAKGELKEALLYFFPIVAFLCGILITESIRTHFRNRPLFHWRQLVVAFEILCLATCIFIPCGKFDIIVNIIVGFVCSMQVEAFRKFHGNPYATTMCTGNLRSASNHLYNYHKSKDKNSLKLSLQYFLVILVFIIGSIIGAVTTAVYISKALLVPCILLLVVILLMGTKDMDDNSVSSI